MEFIFEISNYDRHLFIEQLSSVLEERTELISREKYPKLWSVTDHLNSKSKVDEEVLVKRHKRYRIYGIVIIFLSILLLVPSAMDFANMKFPLLFSIITLFIGIISLKSSKKFRRPSTNSFENSAIELYRIYNKVNLIGQKIIFKGNNFEIGDDVISYQQVDMVVDASDFFVVFFDEELLVLNKKDLINSSSVEFINFLTDKISKSN